MPGGPGAGRGRPPAREVTQGELAVRLAGRLGLGDRLTEDRAIAALTAAGIVPDTGWRRSGPANDVFLVQIQKKVHVLLEGLGRELGIPLPSTLGLQILTPGQLGGQHFETPQPETVPKPADVAQAESRLRTGRETPVSIESPHPYPIGDDQAPVAWSYRVRVPGAAALKLHFARIELGAGDTLRVLDRFGQERWRHAAGTPLPPDGWSGPVPGDTAVIVIHADGQESGWGFQVDRYSFVSK